MNKMNIALGFGNRKHYLQLHFFQGNLYKDWSFHVPEDC